jgi:hypothetical protein
MGHVIGIDTTYTGNPVSFNAAQGGTMKSIVVPLTYTQDLHGYDHPWPAGGGVNKFDGLWQDVSSGNRYSINYIPITENTEYYICTPHIENDYAYIEWYDEDKTLLSRTYVRNGKRTSPVGAKFARLKCWYSFDVTEIAFNYPSTVTTYSPYANICPISGLTGLSVYRTGKNLLDNEELFTYSNWSSTVAPNGNMPSNNSNRIYSLPILKDGQTYTISFGFNGDSFPTYLYFGQYKDGTSNRIEYITTTDIERTFYTFTAEAGYTYCLRMGSTLDESYFDGQIAKWASCQLELGSTATTYEPYNGNTYSVDWSTQAGTVYGGTVDVVTGLLTVDMATVTYNGTESWAKASGQNAFYIPLHTMERPADTYIGKIICDKLQTCIGSSIADFVSAESGITGYAESGYVGQNWIYAKANGATTAAEFKAWLTNNPIQVVYTLAAPLTYQLTPQEIAALIGQNYIWSSNNETLTAVLTAPATGFAGWLIKCVTNGTPVEIPLKYMRAETYTVTPDQRMEWSAERDVTGVLHRETVQNLPPKIEFNTPLMTNSDINALNSIIKAAFTNYLQRNITIQFYDPERDQYWEWDCYMPDVKYHIRNADTVNNIINYEELRYAFIGY